jgi:type I restriction enzyme S subunit
MIKGWKRSTLGEACVIEKGKASAANEPPGPYPLVTTGAERKNAENWQFDGPAVCIPMISAYGHGKPGLKHVHYQEGKFALANILSALLIKRPEELSPKFLSVFLNFYKDHLIVPLQFGAANMSITVERLATVPVWYPSLIEQERILCLLDEAEALRKLRGQASVRMEEFVPALFYEMFGDVEINDKKWKTKSLNDLLAKIESGGSPVCLDRPVEYNEWGMLKLGAITSCMYDDTQNKALPKELEPRPELEVKTRDILFSRKNTHDLVAACVFVFETRPKLMLSDLTFRLCILDENELLPEYLWQAMIQRNKRSKIQTLATGSAAQMPNISKTRLLTIEMPVPPIALQREFAQRVQEARGVQSVQARSEEKIEALYQSMLSRAFAGEL